MMGMTFTIFQVSAGNSTLTIIIGRLKNLRLKYYLFALSCSRLDKIFIIILIYANIIKKFLLRVRQW